GGGCRVHTCIIGPQMNADERGSDKNVDTLVTRLRLVTQAREALPRASPPRGTDQPPGTRSREAEPRTRPLRGGASSRGCLLLICVDLRPNDLRVRRRGTGGERCRACGSGGARPCGPSAGTP